MKNVFITVMCELASKSSGHIDLKKSQIILYLNNVIRNREIANSIVEIKTYLKYV